VDRGTRISADATGLTEVPDVRVAGILADVGAQVMAPAAQGLAPATAINVDLALEDARTAVEATRGGDEGVVVDGAGVPEEARSRCWDPRDMLTEPPWDALAPGDRSPDGRGRPA